MSDFSLQNPVFATYVVAACLMILKAVAMSWLTVVRMMGANEWFGIAYFMYILWLYVYI